MLCDTCRYALTQGFEILHDATIEDPPYLDHHKTLADLEQAVKQLCYICNPIWDALIEIWPDIVERGHIFKSPLSRVELRSVETFGYEIEFHLSHENDMLEPLASDRDRGPDSILGFFGMESVRDDQQQQFAVSNTTNIASNDKIVLSWLRHCLEEHPACKKASDDECYPTRLLDLSCAALANGGVVQLIETATKVMNGPYVTLSHCWGGGIDMKLTTSRLDEFKKGVFVTELPKTFVDAISVAECLGVRYLWIDAMVIIQDSVADWVQESSLMGQVYQHALCNIGATGASNSYQGLFFDRQPELLILPLIELGGRKYQIFNSNISDIDSEKAPLTQRGWVHQERWLCQRMLHFTGRQLFWECRSMVACEERPQDLAFDFYPSIKNDHSLMRGIAADSRQGAEMQRMSRFAKMWGEIIEGYSTAHLTYTTDKLIAMSGIAKAFQKELNDEYLAGHWKRSLIVELTWHVRLSKKRTNEYVAPSWSWFSIDGEISATGPDWWGDPDITEVCTLVDHRLDLRSTDPTGQVNSGYIKLQGPITAVSIYLPHYYSRLSIRGWHEAHRIFIDEETESIPEDRNLYFLALYKKIELTEWNWIRKNVLGVLLEFVPDSTRKFSRVGMVLVDEAEEMETYITPRRIPSLVDLDYDDQRGYTVCIV